MATLLLYGSVLPLLSNHRPLPNLSPPPFRFNGYADPLKLSTVFFSLNPMAGFSICHPKRECKFESRFVLSASVKQSVQQTDDLDDEVCEVVSGLDLTLGEGDDTFDAYLVKAIKNNNGAAVLLLTDVFGFKDNATRDFAYRLSCFGYNVLVPDVFRGEPFKEKPKSEYEEWRSKHPAERVTRDIDTSKRWLLDLISESEANGKLGIVGFCFGGGRLIEALARDDDGHYAAGVCFYGTRIDPCVAIHIKVPVLIISGDQDELCPVDVMHEIGRNTKGSQVVIYPGRGHGFVHRPRSVEEDEDAENAFQAMRSWLHDNLLNKE